MNRAQLLLSVLLLSLLAVSCKSKKGTTVSRQDNPSRKEKEYKALGEKLNLEVDRNDNIKLYSFVADWLGTPHKTGTCNKEAIDCSCFVKLMYEEVYKQHIPRSSKEMFEASKKINTNQLKEGDLVFFNIKASKVSHVGIYLKDGWFAHVSTSKGVMINNLSEKYYNRYYLGCGRF